MADAGKLALLLPLLVIGVAYLACRGFFHMRPTESNEWSLQPHVQSLDASAYHSSHFTAFETPLVVRRGLPARLTALKRFGEVSYLKAKLGEQEVMGSVSVGSVPQFSFWPTCTTDP